MRNNKNSLNVLMFGNVGAGKTSILSQLLSERNLKSLSALGDFVLEIEDEKSKDFIKSSENIMANFFVPEIPIPNGNDTNVRNIYSKFPINTYPTEEEYEISLSVKNASGKRTLQNINFIDYSGNDLAYKGFHVDRHSKKKCTGVTNMVKDADVILFAINSIDLAEKQSYTSDSLLMLLDSLKQCYKQNPSMEKMIIFVPVKFERYYKLNKETLAYDLGKNSEYNSFMTKFYDRHSPLIDWLKDPIRSAQFEVSVLPVLTLGNIEFSCYPDEKISEITISNFEMEDTAAHGIVNVIEPLYQYSDIIFEEDKENAKYSDLPNYSPRFCEYPMAFILSYLVDKILSSKCKRISKTSFNEKSLDALKVLLTNYIKNAPDDFPHTLISSKIFN